MKIKSNTAPILKGASGRGRRVSASWQRELGECWDRGRGGRNGRRCIRGEGLRAGKAPGGTVSAGQSPGGRLLEGGVRVWVGEEVGQAVWAQEQGRFCISN